MQEKNLSDAALDEVTGGATVVEIKAGDQFIPRCFVCKSTDVTVEHLGGYTTITCNKCGAVDMKKDA